MSLTFKLIRKHAMLSLFLSGLALTFGAYGYYQAAFMASKPSLPDFSQYSDVKAKKTAFFEYMLPFVQQANSEILTERKTVLSIDFNKPTAKQQSQLQNLIEKYRLPNQEITPQTQKNLLKKIDTIAPSLALAQAANESGWGTSRFAKDAYNFYGQWCFTKGCGLVPNSRGAGMIHEVRAFKTPYESVKVYMHNLNSHPYFKPLRDQRLQARQNNAQPSGLELATGLIRYSERKEAYITEISSMIVNNNLATLDH